MKLQVGDYVREFAQASMSNNGRIGQCGRVLAVSSRAYGNRAVGMASVATVEFMDGVVVDVEFRFLKKVSAVDALGSLAPDG